MLPKFNYHPDPIATGAIKKTGKRCSCCSEQRGYEYTSSIYCRERPESICPWCIADGSAAEKFDGVFSDGHPLSREGIGQSIIEEVTKRTPGYNSWQEAEWLACCDDACEFHGDVSTGELAEMPDEAFRSAFDDSRLDESWIKDFREGYEPGGNPAIYKWRCRHCGAIKYYADFT
jgi:uncharacterized protein